MGQGQRINDDNTWSLNPRSPDKAVRPVTTSDTAASGVGEGLGGSDRAAAGSQAVIMLKLSEQARRDEITLINC